MAIATCLPIANSGVIATGGSSPIGTPVPHGSADLATCLQVHGSGKYIACTFGAMAAQFALFFLVDTSSIPVGATINSVSLSVWHKCSNGNAPAPANAEAGTTTNGDTEIDDISDAQYDQNPSQGGPSSSYVNWTATNYDLGLNPLTSAPWSFGDINGQWFLWFVTSMGPDGTEYDIDYFAVVVDYTVAGGPTVQVDQLVIEALLDFATVEAAGLGTGQLYPLVAPSAVGGIIVPSAVLSGAAANAISANPTTPVYLPLLGLVPPGTNWGGQPGQPGVPPGTPPGTFICYPLSVFVNDLAARLNDPTFVHWTSLELSRYVVEALRTYNALTQSYKNRESFPSVTGAAFYDLPTVIPLLRAYNVTDAHLVADIEYALMEPPTPTVWTGTSQFTLADVVSAMQRRRDQFLRETGAVVTREVLALTPDVNGRMTVPADIVTIRRAAWVMADGTVVPLKREDEWAFTNYQRTWQTPVPPSIRWPTGYSVGVTPPLSVQLAPPPSVVGSIELISIVNGLALNPSTPVLLGIPDDWTWVVKFGALADLLSKTGVSADSQRAAYCEARWQQGVKLAAQASVVLQGFINGAVGRLFSVQEADIYRRTWETTPGAPQQVLTMGQNMLALSPPPDGGTSAGPYTITLDVVANMPVPISNSDCVNEGLDDSLLDAILDYAEHLALFKEGPDQLTASMDLYQRFVRVCGVEDAIEAASIPNKGAIFQQTIQDTRIVPRETPPEETIS